MRISVDLRPTLLTALDTLAASCDLTRAEVINQALKAYVASNRAPLASFVGLWARSGSLDNPETSDAEAYVANLRSEW